MVTIIIRHGNPGEEVKFELTDQQLFDLFTKTIPGIDSRLSTVEGSVALCWRVLGIIMIGGFGLVTALVTILNTV